jgi:hypothetical protein
MPVGLNLMLFEALPFSSEVPKQQAAPESAPERATIAA